MGLVVCFESQDAWSFEGMRSWLAGWWGFGFFDCGGCWPGDMTKARVFERARKTRRPAELHIHKGERVCVDSTILRTRLILSTDTAAFTLTRTKSYRLQYREAIESTLHRNAIHSFLLFHSQAPPCINQQACRFASICTESRAPIKPRLDFIRPAQIASSKADSSLISSVAT